MIHFHAGQHVRLQIPEIGGVTGEVVEVSDAFLIVNLFLSVHAMPSVLEHPGVVLEYTAVRGLYRRSGTVRFDVGGLDAVRFLPEGDAELIQRRGYARVEVCVPVSVRIDNFRPAIHVESINLSGSGALLQRPPLGSVALPLGTALTLSIAISEDQQPVEARGTVLRELGRAFRFDRRRPPRPFGAFPVRAPAADAAGREALTWQGRRRARTSRPPS